jgi:predicted RNase H-like nuclease (RuvC/YqgF family)
MDGSPVQQHLSAELGGAVVSSAEQLGVPTANSVAAAVQELAAATAADQQGQQLLQQIHQLEREVDAMKQTVAAHTQQSSDHQQDSKQQLQEQQQRTAALATELQELKQRQREQQQQQQRPASPVMEELLADLRQQAQQQIVDIGRQQVCWHVLRPQPHGRIILTCAPAGAAGKAAWPTQKCDACMLTPLPGSLSEACWCG